ncbi:hypothetical protein BOTBODRAFT_221460 [Botryobasidium botryosum FD-172 SS1]|uniref:Uncharacterized protein n=1 Tax=Botryobasidium botryosum (strain FD-172 SS1) TaxID=930990 RepID=A0A067MZL8_BOTB1|nr:hypothetical protein BOTBODRAFT_221460 [Botryobasidium botryosum FD-172 SS1]
MKNRKEESLEYLTANLDQCRSRCSKMLRDQFVRECSAEDKDHRRYPWGDLVLRLYKAEMSLVNYVAHAPFPGCKINLSDVRFKELLIMGRKMFNDRNDITPENEKMRYTPWTDEQKKLVPGTAAYNAIPIITDTEGQVLHTIQGETPFGTELVKGILDNMAREIEAGKGKGKGRGSKKAKAEPEVAEDAEDAEKPATAKSAKPAKSKPKERAKKVGTATRKAATAATASEPKAAAKTERIQSAAKPAKNKRRIKSKAIISDDEDEEVIEDEGEGGDDVEADLENGGESNQSDDQSNSGEQETDAKEISATAT